MAGSAARTREPNEEERAVASLRRGADRAEQMVTEIKRLRAQTTQQQAWLDDPNNPPGDLWFQRRAIWDDRWTMLYQDIGNLTGWVAIHLGEAGRIGDVRIRDRVRQDVDRLLAVETWLEQSGAHDLRQHENQEDPSF